MTSALAAQDCNYQLVLQNLVGEDGWNGADVTVTTGGIAREYSLGENFNEGREIRLDIPVTNGDALTLTFAGGAFDEEITLQLFNNADSLLFAGADPDDGLIFSTTVACVACAPPPLSSFNLFRIRSTTVDLEWAENPFQTTDRYLARIGLAEFDPDTSMSTTLRTRDPYLRIGNLEPFNDYDIYVRTLCANGDTSDWRGPFSFTTLAPADVGVTEFTTPFTDCEPDRRVRIGITNFGGEPQQFFDVNFSVNGGDPVASQPTDGIFTGLVTVDSTEFFTFDANADLDPGLNTIAAWTELPGDNDARNDTTVIEVYNQPILDTFQLPYTESFETNDGFWLPIRRGRGANSWQVGEPLGNFLDDAPDGDRAWVTNLRGDYNNQELSYLQSPCFDLTLLENDPAFSAVMQLQTEASGDAIWLEMTTDDGATWRKVKTSPAAINWYNDGFDQVWEGDGGFNEESVRISNLLPGAAGNVIQLRFAFQTNRSDRREGVLIDLVSVAKRDTFDVAVVEASAGSLEICGTQTDSVTFAFTNVGLTRLDSLVFQYTINSGAPRTETFRGPFIPGRRYVRTFNSRFNGRLQPFNALTVSLAPISADENPDNDLINFSFRTREDLPFFEDFEAGEAPRSWDLADDLVVARRPGEASIVVSDLLDGDLDDSLAFSTANYGFFVPTDTLRFDVFLTDAATGEEPDTIVGRLVVRAFLDCSDELFDVDTLADFGLSGDTMVAIPLTLYNQRDLRFEFIVQHERGEFFVDFDNINVRRCPADLGLTADILNVSAMDAEDGIATINAIRGLPPYSYDWTTGNESMSQEDLAFGEYAVTVSDAVGCVDSIRFQVDIDVSTDEADALTELEAFPNPTSGGLTLRLALPSPTEVSVRLFDVNGRLLTRREMGTVTEINESLPLGEVPPGMYFLRVRAGEAIRTLRIVRN